MGLRWEYKVVERAEPATVVWLNDLGAEGWEVCAIEPRYDPLLGSVQAQYGRLWLFKRMVLEHPSIQAEAASATFQDYPAPVPTTVEVSMPDFKQATAEKPKRKWSADARERARQRAKESEHLQEMRELSRETRGRRAKRIAEAAGQPVSALQAALGALAEHERQQATTLQQEETDAPAGDGKSA